MIILRGIKVKPYLLQTLKEIALLGGIKNKIEISSLELAKQLETSQQTASRYLLNLDKKGFVNREMGIKKQLIQITELGAEVLQQEHIKFQQIFELTDRIYIKGKVVSGLGEGRYYTEQTGYVNQFEKKLGFIPYPGTLNVEIEYIERNKLRLLKNYSAIDIEEFSDSNRTFGRVKCFKAEIAGINGAIVLPFRTHYSNILEFISPDNLREKLNLEDGGEINIIIYFKQ
jgi:riboflavin kinase